MYLEMKKILNAKVITMETRLYFSRRTKKSNEKEKRERVGKLLEIH